MTQPTTATTAAGTTSVGTAAVPRFVCPVAYQDFPLELLLRELQIGGEAGHLRVPVRKQGENKVKRSNRWLADGANTI